MSDEMKCPSCAAAGKEDGVLREYECGRIDVDTGDYWRTVKYCADYNGWRGNGTHDSAYATWRVALEVFDGGNDPHDSFNAKPDAQELADWCENIVTEYVDDSIGSGLYILKGWVDAFLDDVSWEEIADNILSDWEG